MSVISPDIVQRPVVHSSAFPSDTAVREPVAQDLPAARPGGITVVAIEDAGILLRHEVQWTQLAADAAEANVFLEPWQLIPAIQAFGSGKRSLFLLVFQAPRHPGAGDFLIGFFPFERRTRLRGLPIDVLTTWDHPHRFLGTPLIRAGHASEAWGAALDWLIAHRRQAGAVVELPLLGAEGPQFRALIDAIRERGLLTLSDDLFTRAALDRTAPLESRHALGDPAAGGMRKEWRRQRRRLAENGQLETRRLEAGADATPWIEAFLGLERSGWKGRSGTAIASRELEAQFFRRMAGEAHRLGRLQMLGLYLDGTPIALKCNFTSGRTLFTFKIAFDEAFKAYSPGVLLELDNIDAFDRGLADHADSCAIPGHPMIGRLWHGRRAIAHLLISTSSRRGTLALGAISALRALKRSLKRADRSTGRSQ